MLQVGDIVKVVDVGEQYSTYFDFFKENHIEQYLKFYGEYKTKGEEYWKWINSGVKTTNFYEIQIIGKHRDDKVSIAVISTLDYSEVFLIGIKGIKKVKE